MTNSVAKPAHVTASRLVRTGRGLLFGIIVNSHSSGTLKLWDNTTATASTRDNVMETFTFASGSSVITFPVPIEFTTGLFATVGNTADLTLLLD